MYYYFLDLSVNVWKVINRETKEVQSAWNTREKVAEVTSDLNRSFKRFERNKNEEVSQKNKSGRLG